MQLVLDYLKRHQARFVAELCDYLRLPSVSAQPQHKKDLQACADWLAKHCRQIGLDARVCPTQGHPIVVAKTPASARAYGAPQRGLQTASRISWSMAITTCSRRNRWSCGSRRPSSRALPAASIFARGTTDNKGQHLAHLKAVEAYLKTGTPLPCDLTFVIEGEEEVGSANLAKFLKSHRNELECDAVVISDTGMPDAESSGADLCLARHHCLRNHAARPVARFAFRHLRRRGGQSGDGPEPVAGPGCATRTGASPFPVFTTTSRRFPPTNAEQFKRAAHHRPRTRRICSACTNCSANAASRPWNSAARGRRLKSTV